MSPIRGVLFDKDGTLFDFSATWEGWCAGLLARLTMDAPEAARLGAEIGFDVARRRFLPGSIVVAGTPGEIAAAMLPHLPEHSPQSLLDVLNEEASTAPQIEVVPLAPFLGALRRDGLRLGVATNDSEAPARAHLEQAQISHLFDFIAGFDSGHGGKPAPGQLLAFAHAVGLEPAEIVMVGDSLHDLRAGRAAGMRCVGVLSGLADRAELSPHADIVMDTIAALPAWIADQAPG